MTTSESSKGTNGHTIGRENVSHGNGIQETLLEEDAIMPIAIIGMAGRFPGDATSPEKLWDLIVKGIR
jgi:hypothetical protein